MDATASGPSFAELLAAFPDLVTLARALELPRDTVAAWKRRNSIPEKHWRAIEAAAKAHGVAGVSYEHLSLAAQAQRQPALRRAS